MNDVEQYEFDRLGYLVIPNFLTEAEVTSLCGRKSMPLRRMRWRK